MRKLNVHSQIIHFRKIIMNQKCWINIVFKLLINWNILINCSQNKVSVNFNLFEWFDISKTFSRLMVEINGFCPFHLLKLFVDKI